MNTTQLLSQKRDTIKKRNPSFKNADISCIRAIVQAAVNVELFTIPLYMTSMYSIYGLHQINAKGSDFYTGRYWPGSAPTGPMATSANAKTFNLIFKVFIEEMLHLQLASNMATTLGVNPDFNSPLLQDSDFGWICYNSTTIPHILDFQDCIGDFKKIEVKLNAMNAEQVKLFLAIEQTEDTAKTVLNPDTISTCEKPAKYFECAPYDWWKPSFTEVDLPLFGSIGWMYTCFWDYLEIEYTDGTKLLDFLVGPVQQDQFNLETPGHPMKEYPKIDATISVTKDGTTELKKQFMNAINAITDQGEGGGVVAFLTKRWNLPTLLKAVDKQFQPDPEALKKDYPGYNDKGGQIPVSGQAEARISSIKLDHFEVFQKVQQLIGEKDYMTWDMWHKNPANKWTAEMLNPSGTKSPYNIPSAEDVAGALNELKSTNTIDNHKLFSQAAVGTIKGITTQLNTYWQKKGAQFPSPAMYGSGDRVSICWAVTGQAPDLSMGVSRGPGGLHNHACQGMDLTKEPSGNETCAAVEVYHSCKGSNDCKTEGGCGFVQNSEGGGNCSSVVLKAKAGCGLQTMSAPANNKCATFGGCAVPISASQLFPQPGSTGSYVMQLFNYGPAPEYKPESLVQMQYAKTDAVYDIAWKAYTTVMAKRFPGKPAPKMPKPSAMRLAFPPST
jgi:hypothetical protein